MKKTPNESLGVVIRAASSFLILALLLSHTAPLSAKQTLQTPLPYKDPSLPVATRVADLLARMTLDEKIGQMTQVNSTDIEDVRGDITSFFIGSILSGGGSSPAAGNTPTDWANLYDSFQDAALATRLGIPIIYGIDAVHGHNNVFGATIFPHNIGLGATRNPALVQQVGAVTAEEMAGTGIDWNFSPCLCVARNERWGRTYESFGEDTALVQSMTPIINGYQGTSLNGPTSVLATAKHYVGDGGTTSGVDQGNTQLSEAELRAIHLAPYRDAIQRNVGSIMISFSSWNGQKLHGHQFLITNVLKNELGFTGIVVSDWAGIDQLPGTYASDVRTSINAGLDMIMVPSEYQLFINTLRSEVNAGNIPMSRIDDAVRRILTKKFELGLFEAPKTNRTFTSSVGSAAHRMVARQAVRESLVLLKNANNILPLSKTTPRIFVAGKSADNIGLQSGGWTITWQGGSGNITPGTTILQGIRNTVSAGTTVTFNRTAAGINNTYNVAIVVVGETPYAEGEGDRPASLGLDAEDINTLNTVRASGVPMVVILVSGRPMIITSQLPDWSAFVAAWLPGTEGQGVADVLFGDFNFTGRLPQSWPQSESQIPINVGDASYNPLFPFGFGLSYGTPPTLTPTRTTGPTLTPTRTPSGTATATAVGPTNTPTRTPTGTATATAVGPTLTPTRTPTGTPSTPVGGAVNRVRFFPRASFANRMVGGIFQGSNTSTTAGFVNLATITTQPAQGAFTELTFTNTTAYRYVRYLSPNNGFGNVAEVEFYSGTTRLTGTGFGTAGSWQNGGNTFDRALDGNTATFFDGPTGNGIFVGIDTGTTGPTLTPTRTNTATPSGTPVGPTATSTLTRTNTPVGPTPSGTATNTPVGPTNTPTRTPTRTPSGTPVGPTNTPTRTNTPVVGGCTVTYTVNDWNNGAGGFTGNVTITNNGATAINGWTLAWTFANQRLDQGWEATVTQPGGAGTAVSAVNLGHNATIGPNGGSRAFGFNATYFGANPRPASFTLNGTACTVN